MESTKRYSSEQERGALSDFAERYSVDRIAALIDMERRVIGSDWGANGFTTLAQADILAKKLSLGAGDLVLDVGSGRGWPGLYLAQRTGCSVVLSDLPVEGLRLARQRAAAERVGLVGAVVCSAKHLPFRHRAFEAIVHTDVLC